MMLITVNRKLCETLQTSIDSVCLAPGGASAFWTPGRKAQAL